MTKPAKPSEVRCAIYTRVSTVDQARGDFSSIDNQRESAEALIRSQQSNGWVALETRYDDGGFSAATTQRPALQDLLHDIDAGQVDVVVVYKLDRLSRSQRDLLELLDRLAARGVAFKSVTQNFDTSGPMGKAMVGMLAVFAELERGMIRERTRDKMIAARKKGRWIGGPVPLGYDLHPDGGAIVVNPDEAERVRATYRLYLQQESLTHTQRELRARGWKTKTWMTKRGKLHQGTDFTKESLRRLLTDPRYIGKIEHEGVLYEAQHDGIVDEVLWKRVQERLERNRRHSGAEVRNKRGALLKGILRCKACDSAMVHSHYQRKGRVYRYYVCVAAQKKSWDACPTKQIPAADLDACIVERIAAIGENQELLDATVAAAEQQSHEAIATAGARVAELERALTTLRDEELALAKARASGGADRPAVGQRLAEIDREVERLQSELFEAESELASATGLRPNAERISRVLRSFTEIWEVLGPRERARIVRMLVRVVEYDGETGKVSVELQPLGAQLLTAELDGEVAA